ncbi:MBL fold metallo-hydrolase [Natroniella sulfidigena]|uniref:MBL fold metallo-hydrolase n=1 Tax=Natroniella sulfidigena TaxID=723921 RepID=UPI00200A60E3|nr:MBL fold metallo-hydrolase [Natroniella sulfidigena]MCK8817681.1 MBL fold metallo-hydrolase [Natroniella sulfidigena]
MGKLKGTANIYHLYHSGVAVETESKLLIFDYYNDSPVGKERSLETGVVDPDIFSRKEQGLVFVSHNHNDHFNPVIFEWEQKVDNLHYILSDDLQVNDKKENYYQLGKYQQLELEDVTVNTYGTTDQGVSFLVEVDGLVIFHAGDLNWWHWNKFSPAERKQEEREYKEELARLPEVNIDLAFVPVDPRLEEHYYRGGEYFAQEFKPNLLVPIHFSNNYEITEEFADKIADLAVDSAVIKKRGSKISYSSL